MNPVSEDVKDKLVASGVGVFVATSGWAIYIAKEPTTPNTTISLYDYPGPPPQYFQDRTKDPLRMDNFQVRVRGTGYKTAYEKIRSIQETIRQYDIFTVGTVKYYGFVSVGDILFLKIDEHDRYIWVASFQAHRTET